MIMKKGHDDEKGPDDEKVMMKKGHDSEKGHDDEKRP
jgi:hypothetical protein